MRRGETVALGDGDDPSPGARTNALDVLGGASAPTAQLSERLTALVGLGLDQLRTKWRRLYRSTPPPRLSRDLLQRSIAHRLQEEVLGGLPPAAQRQMAAKARALAANGEPTATVSAVRLKAGTTLVREWHGRTHIILVHEKGFEHDGKHYASLTQIARSITGAHWSGPRFFGLRRRDRAGVATTHGAADGD